MITDEMLKEALLEVELAIADATPDSDDHDCEFSPDFEDKMEKLIRKTDYPHNYGILKRVACILISFLVFGSLLLNTRMEAEASIVDWVKERFEDVYHYFFVPDEEPAEIKSFYLEWLPDDYVLLDSIDTDYGKTIMYQNSIGEIISFIYLYGSNSTSLDVGRGEYEEKHISQWRFDADIYLALENDKANAIFWKSKDGNVVFTIFGFVGENKLIKMAKNLVVE